MPPESARRAAAFAPGHVTGIFDPDRSATDPRARGSRGIGLVLELGVVADVRWDRARSRRVVVRSDVPGPLPISTEVAVRLAAPFPGRLVVRLRHELPVGQGFGMSAAGALATGLAVAAVLGVPRQRAVEVAHLADLFGGGGLGGVAAILGGGLEVRRSPGIPPWGTVRHRPVEGPVLVGVVGDPIASPRILFDARKIARIHRAARSLDRIGRAPSLPAFFEASERFTDAVGLASPALRTVLRGLRRRGVPAAQAMFGTSFFARPSPRADRRELTRWLARTPVRGAFVDAAGRGARRLGAKARTRAPQAF